MIDFNDQDNQIILKPFADGLRPVPLMTVSEWSNTHRFLTSASSAEPGRYRVSRMPYNRKIMDCLGKTSDIQEVIYVKSSQVGGTELGNCWIGYTIHLDPSPFMLVMPTDDAIKKNSRTRIKPMIESSPVLNERIKAVGSKDAENTINNKTFPGGALMMVGANSPTPLSSTPIAKLMLDEVDRYPLSAGEEGSPVELARARTRTFANRKILMISTPTNEGVSVIWAEFMTTDQQYYYVPCQFCEELFVLRFEYLTWAEGKPETVRMACPNCGGLHEEKHKTPMFEEKGFSENGRAEWIATAKTEDPRKTGFHVSSLYSPAGMYSWEELVRDFLKIKGDQNKEQTFINTVLGETYKIVGEVPDSEALYNRRESYQLDVVPYPVYFLTMGVDVQTDRLECEVVGWCIGRETYSMGYHVLIGDTSKEDVWQQLKDLINSHYVHSDGSLMPIKITCVDSGYNTKKVYDFCDSMGHSRVIPVKGMDTLNVMVNAPKSLNVAKSGKKIGTSKVWGLGVSLLKSELYGFLKLPAIQNEGAPDTYPAGYCHFPEYDREYFKMLTAEQLQMLKNKKTGKVTYQWVKKQPRNEALDCRVYARAAAYIIGIDRFKPETWKQVKDSTKIIPPNLENIPTAKTVKKQSSFWKR
jgi:phage terminase large subunit GpA-like protein